MFERNKKNKERKLGWSDVKQNKTNKCLSRNPKNNKCLNHITSSIHINNLPWWLSNFGFYVCNATVCVFFPNFYTKSSIYFGWKQKLYLFFGKKQKKKRMMITKYNKQFIQYEIEKWSKGCGVMGKEKKLFSFKYRYWLIFRKNHHHHRKDKQTENE